MRKILHLRVSISGLKPKIYIFSQKKCKNICVLEIIFISLRQNSQMCILLNRD